MKSTLISEIHSFDIHSFRSPRGGTNAGGGGRAGRAARYIRRRSRSAASWTRYYAWDFGRPAAVDRSFAGGTLFTTQPARHNEFNVNLAFVEAKLDGPRIRGRLALQAGTSVQSNYSGEPTRGQVSGPSLARHLQEAFAGAKLGDNVWVDGGIFYSHMGMEGWVIARQPDVHPLARRRSTRRTIRAASSSRGQRRRSSPRNSTS